MNKTVRFFCYVVLGSGVLALLMLEWSRSRAIASLSQDNQSLREQLNGIEVARSEIEDLQALRDHLRRSIDSFAVENESLRSENSALRQQTNQLAQLQARLFNSLSKNERLAQGLRELQAELNAKPSIPRLGAWLGVEIRDLNEKDPFPERTGVIIMQVTYHGPADIAKVYQGDRIFSIDGEVIANTQHFKNILAQKAVGQPLALQLARGDNLLTLAVKPSDWPQ